MGSEMCIRDRPEVACQGVQGRPSVAAASRIQHVQPSFSKVPSCDHIGRTAERESTGDTTSPPYGSAQHLSNKRARVRTSAFVVVPQHREAAQYHQLAIVNASMARPSGCAAYSNSDECSQGRSPRVRDIAAPMQEAHTLPPVSLASKAAATQPALASAHSASTIHGSNAVCDRTGKGLTAADLLEVRKLWQKLLSLLPTKSSRGLPWLPPCELFYKATERGIDPMAAITLRQAYATGLTERSQGAGRAQCEHLQRLLVSVGNSYIKSIDDQMLDPAPAPSPAPFAWQPTVVPAIPPPYIGTPPIHAILAPCQYPEPGQCSYTFPSAAGMHPVPTSHVPTSAYTYSPTIPCAAQWWAADTQHTALRTCKQGRGSHLSLMFTQSNNGPQYPSIMPPFVPSTLDRHIFRPHELAEKVVDDSQVATPHVWVPASRGLLK